MKASVPCEVERADPVMNRECGREYTCRAPGIVEILSSSSVTSPLVGKNRNSL
jgi:hypothetical protein